VARAERAEPEKAEPEAKAAQAEAAGAAGVQLAEAEAAGAEEAEAEEAEAAGATTSPLFRAFEDDKLCQHFLSEPSVEAGITGMSVHIVRVGKAEKIFCGIRSKSVGITAFRKSNVLWAADVTDGGGDVLIARIQHSQGNWSPVLRAATPNALGRLILDATGASKKTKLSAPKFFGIDYFKNLGKKRHMFPTPESPARCFSCAGVITGKHRYDETTLARLCDSWSCRKRKRRITEPDNDEGQLILNIALCWETERLSALSSQAWMNTERRQNFLLQQLLRRASRSMRFTNYSCVPT
jgi:hypothetical protein